MQASASSGRNGKEQEEFLELRRRLAAGEVSPGARAALEFGEAFAAAPDTLTRAHRDRLVEHFGPGGAVEIMVFVAWQASGLRAIHSWAADLLFGAPDVRLAYADGPSLFVANGVAADGGRRPEVEDVVPFLRRERPWEPAALDAVREAWRGQGTPPGEWFEFLAAAPRVLWGWSEFHRLTWAEGLLPARAKTRALALLAGRLGHPRWVEGLIGRMSPPSITATELDALAAGDFERFDPKSRAVLTYVERLEREYLTIDDAFVADVAGTLSAGELVEAGMFTGLQLGSIRLARFVSG